MKNKKQRRSLMAGILIGSAILLSGCGTDKIFVNEEDAYKIVNLSDRELENDKYYVKTGADFNVVYRPNGTATAKTQMQSDSRLFWTMEDDSLIPTLYKNEVIAYQSENTQLTDITLERFKNIGYSIGLYGGVMSSDGYIDYNIQSQIVENCSAYDILYNAPSKQIRLATINDEPVTDDMLDSSGTIKRLDQNGTYDIGFYSGTKYMTATMSADVHFYQSYEISQIEKAGTTKNGYLAIPMPEDAKSGYYMMNGSGLYRYYAFEKNTENVETVDMNEPFYETEEEKIAAYSQQYMVSVQTKTTNVAFNMEYDTEEYEDDEIKCILVSPDGTTYNLVPQNGTASIELAEVIAGRWTINVLPKDLIVKDIKAESTAATADSSTETKSFYIGEDDENIQFYAQYEGEGDVWGIVENESGESQELDVDTQNHELTTTYSYLAAGTYTMTIYHYKDTKIGEMGYQVDTDNEEHEIITIGD